jgi:hypothetical protein
VSAIRWIAGTRTICRPRRVWPSLARTAAAIIATAALALPAAAFGNSQQTNVQKALAYSRCMRSHGVSRFPDPTSVGVIPKVTLALLGVGSAALQSAQAACRNLLPSTLQPGPPSQAELRQAWSNTLRFARCMRSDGVAGWPDPTSDSPNSDRPNFNLPVGIDLNSPRIAARIRECEPLLDGWSPYVNSAGNLPGT